MADEKALKPVIVKKQTIKINKEEVKTEPTIHDLPGVGAATGIADGGAG